MLDTSARENIALKRFSLISPVLNGQIDNQKEYFETICLKPIEMPHYGLKIYAPKTLSFWLSEYRRGGIDALKPGYRSDRGKSRKVTSEVAQRIKEIRSQKPRLTSILLYEELVKEGTILPENLSQATFYRFLANNPDLASGKNPGDTKEEEFKRFSHSFVNELWQTDIMYGPYVKEGKSKKQTYLIAFIDDASRLITGAEFFVTQNFEALRSALKEAVLKRGIPKIIYTDNGKVYRSSQLALICAGLGCSLIHTEPFTPTSKGKIERFFHTVRQRFLTQVDPTKLSDLMELNLLFWKWLEDDYQHKMHSAIQMTPLDFFMSQAERLTLFKNPLLLEEHFLLKVMRKVNHDATLSIDSILYETEQRLANSRLEVRYDPQWLLNPNQPVLLFKDGLKVGEARQVNFNDNAYVKRKARGRPYTGGEPSKQVANIAPVSLLPAPSISFASFMDEMPVEAGTSGKAGEN